MRASAPQAVPRLADQVALGVLTRTFPPELVDEVVAATGRVQRRHRLLPARLMVYYVLGLALFSGMGSVEVLRCLVEGLREQAGWRHPREPWRSWHLPAKSALIQARARLGPEPLRVLFERAARPLASQGTRGAFYRGWRVMSLDGTCLDVADSPANATVFGRPGSSRGEGGGGFPSSGWSGWPSAAPMRWSRRCWGPAPPVRARWPTSCWRCRGGWARSCWCWPTVACGALTAGVGRHHAAPRWCGGSRPARPGRGWRPSGSWLARDRWERRPSLVGVLEDRLDDQGRQPPGR
jgi:Insertion element 4 transposase N-terminal